MKKKIGILLLSSIVVSAFSQEEQKSSLQIEGQLAITTNAKDVFVNVGGPSLKFNLSKVAFAFNFLPSLRFHEIAGKIQVSPILGSGIQVYGLKDKRLVLSFPWYYLAATNSWTFTCGLGYVFSKSKH